MTVARLVLQDGTIFRGQAVGAPGTVTGEAVFNTSMTGYQEILTDPSYRGQIVTMTYPEIGNYGIAREDMESGKAQVAGFVMRQCCPRPSNFRAVQALSEYLAEQRIVAVEGIDTRMLTRRLRVVGAMPAVISSEDRSDAELIALVKAAPSMAGQDLASGAGTRQIYEWTDEVDPRAFGHGIEWTKAGGNRHVVAFDMGCKRNILRLLRSCGFRVTVVPADTPADTVLGLKPEGIFVSNGPGDPAAVKATPATLRALIPTGLPIFGICLGHQMLGLALGARTFKLKFGHRGANHPIKNLKTGRIEIASHNHGFAVDIPSLPAEAEMTHLNLNDHTCAGLAHRSKPVFCVQYHPEACPGPSDPLYLFRQFAELVTRAA